MDAEELNMKNYSLDENDQDDLEYYLNKLERKVGEWGQYNFGKTPEWHQLLGIQEEAGEVAHHYLKMVQGIRGTKEEHLNEIKDGLVDTFIFILHFAYKMNIDFGAALNEIWNEVSKRDFTKNKLNGKV